MRTGQKYWLEVKITTTDIDGSLKESYDTIGDEITISDARMLISRYVPPTHWRVSKFTLEPIK